MSANKNRLRSRFDLAYDGGMSQTQDILKALKARGFSQVEIARRTQIPQPRLSRWHKGEVPDSADDALKLAALAAEPIRKSRAAKMKAAR